MLTPQSYVLAMAIYATAALVAVFVMHRFWFRAMPRFGSRLLSALLLAWLLTPAQPSAGSETLAPALVVALFNGLLGDGWPAARQAVVVLIMSSGLSGLVALASLLIPSRASRKAADPNQPS